MSDCDLKRSYVFPLTKDACYTSGSGSGRTRCITGRVIYSTIILKLLYGKSCLSFTWLCVSQPVLARIYSRITKRITYVLNILSKCKSYKKVFIDISFAKYIFMLILQTTGFLDLFDTFVC